MTWMCIVFFYHYKPFNIKTKEKFNSKNWNSQRACWRWSWKTMIKNLTLKFWINISRCCGAPETCLMGKCFSQTKLKFVQPKNQAKPTHSGRIVAVKSSICYNELFWLAPLDPKILYRLLRDPAVLFFQFLCTDGNVLSTCSNHPMSVNTHKHQKRAFLDYVTVILKSTL